MTPLALSRLYARAFPDLRPWSEAEFKRMLETPGTHLATSAHGFAIARSVGPEAEIITIATDPDHRRQGIARAVLTDLISGLSRAEVETVVLEVAADNHAARAFYDEAGFIEVGLRRGYYRRSDGSRVDAHILSRARDPADAP